MISKKKKRFVKNKRKRNMMIQTLLLLFVFLGIGYATLSTRLGIGGNLYVSKPICQTDNKLYNVLKCAVDDGLALEYTANPYVVQMN